MIKPLKESEMPGFQISSAIRPVSRGDGMAALTDVSWQVGERILWSDVGDVCGQWIWLLLVLHVVNGRCFNGYPTAFWPLTGVSLRADDK